MNHSERVKKLENLVGVDFGVLKDEATMNAMSETERADVILRSLTQVLPEEQREQAGDMLCLDLSEQRGIKTRAEATEAFINSIEKLPEAMRAPLEAVVHRFIGAVHSF